jgi:acyl dehydratase
MSSLLVPRAAKNGRWLRTFRPTAPESRARHRAEETRMPYLEDFAVGDRTAYGRYEVTREEVVAFAERYDPQPFHLSDEGAAATHFGRLAASGWQTCAMSMAMNVAALRDAEEGGSLGAVGIDELRWLRPVHPGDVLRCESEVLEVRPSASRPDMGSVRSRLTVFNQQGEAVLRYVPIVLYRRRDQTASRSGKMEGEGASS